MSREELSNPLLRRYWFRTRERIGFGVTAYSLSDARRLVEEAARGWGLDYEAVEVVEDVDVRDLDPRHVRPNVGLVNVRGVWFPGLNLS